MDEMAERDRIIDAVNAAIVSKDLARLNAMADEYRQSRARTPSGAWKSGIFHGAVQYKVSAHLKRSKLCTSPYAGVVRDWLAAHPEQPAAIITMADMRVAQGWCFRGGSYANRVSQREWQGLRRNTQAAYELLDDNRSIASTDPEYYAVMAELYRAMSKSPSELASLIDEAASREPYYMRTYFRAAQSYLPKWGGRPGDLDLFARYAAEKTRTSDKTGFYYRIYWYLEHCDCASPWGSGDWGDMKQAMRDVYERYPVEHNARHMLDVSCKAGDYDEALRYMRLLHPDATSDADFSVMMATCEYEAKRAV